MTQLKVSAVCFRCMSFTNTDALQGILYIYSTIHKFRLGLVKLSTFLTVFILTRAAFIRSKIQEKQ